MSGIRGRLTRVGPDFQTVEISLKSLAVKVTYHNLYTIKSECLTWVINPRLEGTPSNVTFLGFS